MKYINHILLLVIGALFLNSCEVIDLTPISSVTESNFYKTADDIDQSVLGIYSNYQSRISRDWTLFEMPADGFHPSTYKSISGLEEMANLDFQPQNELFKSFWQSNYNGIFRCNAVLTHIEVPTNYNSDQKNQLKGEALFMRALYYFDMVRAFGGVPEVLTTISVNESKTIPRSTEEQIYSTIVADLKEATGLLQEKANVAKGRATKGAAFGLLGKVYIYLENWSEANNALEEVSKLDYSLLDNFSDLWTLENEDNDEIIFAIKYVEGSNGQSLSSDFLPYFGVEGISTNGGELANISWSIQKLFIEEDSRKNATITETWKSPGSTETPEWRPYVSKYAVPHVPFASGLDLPILRYADILLLRAEALYNLNQPEEAVQELNKVRSRAFGNDTQNYTTLDVPDTEAFYDKLLKERALELAYENERWFDLTRTGRFMTVLTEVEWSYNPSTGEAQKVSLNPQAYKKLFPIPQHEIDQSDAGVIEQNDGY